MIVGIVKEIKNNEYRVSATPENVKEYIQNGHTVYVESNSGVGANFGDEEYLNVGAKILYSSKEVYQKSDMIIKVKEPLEEEFEYLKDNQILFTYLHLAANKKLTKVLLEKNITAIGYETIEDKIGGLPCLRPMSEIAGKLSIQQGAKYIESTYGGKGILLGGVTGVERGKIVILGGGTVGTHAAKVATGLGAQVTIIDRSINRLAYLDDVFGSSITTLYSTKANIEKSVISADLVIGSILIPGASAPKMITEDMVKKMKKGSVIVDVAIDQGGCAETSIVTTHENPVYIKHGIVHYCVGNMPGAVPHTATMALTNATQYYGLRIANEGIENFCRKDNGFLKGVNTYKGMCVNKNLADSLNLEYFELLNKI